MADLTNTFDLEACFDPVFLPPLDFLEECRKWQDAKLHPSACIVERRIGGTVYQVETLCNGNELLSDKVKRLVFSEKEAV